MRKLSILLLIPLFIFQVAAQNHKEPNLAILNVNIVDVESGSITPGMDVLIKGDRIEEVRPSNPDLVKAAFRVDGSGKYLIPGLWDMHAHPDDPEMWRMRPDQSSRDLLMPLFVMYGVTGIRDMAGSLKVVNDWKEKMANGSLLGPAIFAAGPLIDGPNPMWDGSIGIPSVQQVPQKIDSLKEAGVDFLKIYSLLPDSIYFALSEYARSIDFPFCGHVPQTVTNLEASNSGISSLEHLLDIPLECSSEEERIRNGTIDYGGAEGRLDRYLFRNKRIIDTYDSEKAARLFEAFVQNDTWHTPTISMWYKNAWFEKEETKDQQYFRYLPVYMRKYWTPQVNDHLKFRQKEFIQVNQQLVDHYMRIIGDMHKAGVKLLAGTDTGANPLCWPGLGVHLEIEMFEKAGLTPHEALKTATINPVRFLGIEEDYGTIAKGKYADMILLSDNPLESISNTQKIAGVVKSGSFFSKTRINEYLEKIAERQ
ncbi:MAG: amidohydrolase family protein [Cyclobacteriaceae bacterium]